MKNHLKLTVMHNNGVEDISNVAVVKVTASKLTVGTVKAEGVYVEYEVPRHLICEFTVS